MTLSLTKKELISGWVYAAFEFLVLPVLLSGVCYALGIASNAIANLIYYCVNALGCIVIFRRVLLRSLDNHRNLVYTIFRGLGLYYLGSLVAVRFIFLMDPGFANVNDTAVSGMIAEYPLMMALAVVFLVPIAEECIFRGLLFVPFAGTRPALGYTVSSLCFAAAHITGYIGVYDGLTLGLCFLQYIPAGLALCWACKRADSLMAPILIHTLLNAMSVLLL